MPVGGIPDFLEDKKTGLFCRVRDPQDLADKIESLMNDANARAGLVAAARRMVSERYEWDAIARLMREKVLAPLYALKRERILIATGLYPPDIGGPAKYARYLSEEFRKMGYANFVSVFPLRWPSGIRHAAYALSLIVPLRLSDSVLILDTFSCGVPASLMARLFRKKIVVRVGGDFLWEQYAGHTRNSVPLDAFYLSHPRLSAKERLIFRLTRGVLRRANAVAFNTAWQQELWREPYRLARENIAVVGNYFGTMSAPSVKPASKEFVVASRPIFIKNLDRLTRAFALARKRDQSISLSVLRLPHEELMKRIASCRAVVLPSLSEVYPNLALEAIRAGRPFICTKHTGLPERFRPFGIFVDPLDEKDIARGILELSDDKRYADIMARLQAFRYSREWSDVAADFIKLLIRP